MNPLDKLTKMLEQRAREQLGPIEQLLEEVIKEQKRTNELLEKILGVLRK